MLEELIEVLVEKVDGQASKKPNVDFTRLILLKSDPEKGDLIPGWF